MIRVLAATGLSALAFAACVRQPQPARLGLKLAPATLGESISLQQHLRVEREGRIDELDVALEVDPDRLDMVGFVLGQRILTLHYDGRQLQSWRHPLVPEQLRGEDVLEDLQLTLWPADVIRQALTDGWTLEESGRRRTLLLDAAPVMIIDYDSESRWNGKIELANLRYQYRLTIQSVVERSMTTIYLNQLGIISPLGNTVGETKRRMLERVESGVAPTDFYSAGHPLPLGRIDPALSLPPAANLPWRARSRNNQLALAALNQIRPAVAGAIERFGSHRVGVVIGTSTSGIADGEKALREYGSSGILPSSFHYGQLELGSPAAALAQTLGTTGPAFTHSSACASSAKALASAARLILMKACDAVIAGGVDTLCAFTLAGFAALESLSATRCNPLSRNRNGINIGEGAALFLMSCQPAAIALCGWGESSDGHHMSAPDPAGSVREWRWNGL